MEADPGRSRRRRGFATRLLVAQALVLLAGATTSWIVATSLGPGIFQDHLDQAGVSHTPSEVGHVKAAFNSAMVLALVVALIVSLIIALTVSWLLTRRIQHSVASVTDSADRMAGGDYRARAARPGLGAEFDQLTTTINQLAERLDAVERTRRRMLSDLAHEMRTPLATIDAHLDAIEDGIRAADAQTVAVLRSSTRRLNRLAQDIGAVSRAEEGQLHLETAPLVAADLVRSAIIAARPAAREKGIELVESVGSESARVMADSERMGQVLANLIENAIRHSPPKSTVVISCRRTDPCWVDIAVSDSGDGIAPEHLDHVFDRFYRADGARNRSQGGSGIGLTITRALVHAHHGQVSASSPGPGLGATFTVRLPVTVPAGAGR